MDTTVSSIASIEVANCDSVYASVSNLSSIDDPLAMHTASSERKRKMSFESIREQETPNERTVELTTPQKPAVIPQTSTVITHFVDHVKGQPKPRNDATALLKLANFEIVWDIIPKDIIYQLEGHQPEAGFRGISQTNYNRMVDHVVAQIRGINTKIPLSVFKNVAMKITTAYPSLRDRDDDGGIIGDGASSLADKLRNHNSYLNRTHRTDRQTLQRNICSHRQCKVGIREEYAKSGKKGCSKEHLLLLTRENSERLSEEMLLGTEQYVRYQLDCSMSLKTLHQQLPMLRRNELLNHHFLKATGINADTFATNFKKKKEKLIEVSGYYSRQMRIPANATDCQIFEGVSRLLGENFSTCVHEIEVNKINAKDYIVKCGTIIIYFYL